MRELAVPVGVALAVGTAVAHVVPPEWRAAGLSYSIGYGKNVEHAAVTAGLLAGLGSVWLLGSKLGRLVAQALAAVGFAILAWRVDWAVIRAGGWIPLALAVLLAVALRPEAKDGGGIDPLPAPPPREGDLPRALVAVLLGGLTLFAFVLAVRPLTIDVFHHGEVLASAVDLLAGGRPFESFLWPHGFHDSGLAALWIWVTGKIGTSPVAFAQATCRALGVLTAFALAWRLLGSRVAALATSAALVLAVVLERRAESDAVIHLEQLGVLLFVVLALLALLSSRAHAELVAGVLLGLAYVFRLETGVYGAVAAVAVLVRRDGRDVRTRPAVTVRRLAASVGRLLIGVGLPLLLLRVCLGWPGLAWFSYTLLELPRHHRDAVGVPFPWPLTGPEAPPWSAFVGLGLARLLFVLLILVRALSGGFDEGGTDRAAARSRALLFLAVFAALAMHSALDRSDGYHLRQWAVLPVLGVVLLVVAGVRDRRRWPAWGTAVLLVVVLNVLDLSGLSFIQPDGRGLSRLAADPGRQVSLLLEHWKANPPVGECGDRSFTETEARRRDGRRFIEATCEVERALRADHVKNLVIAHSAPWYYVRFGLPTPTRYFAFARAYTPEAQRELVADLRARRPEALLRVRDFGALEEFDVPDAVRVPIVDAYLRERSRGVAPRPTPLGDLYLWNEPEAAALAVPADSADSAGARAEMSLAQVRVLRELSGAEWRGLDQAVSRAAAEGAEDRRLGIRSTP